MLLEKVLNWPTTKIFFVSNIRFFYQYSEFPNPYLSFRHQKACIIVFLFEISYKNVALKHKRKLFWEYFCERMTWKYKHMRNAKNHEEINKMTGKRWGTLGYIQWVPRIVCIFRSRTAYALFFGRSWQQLTFDISHLRLLFGIHHRFQTNNRNDQQKLQLPMWWKWF